MICQTTSWNTSGEDTFGHSRVSLVSHRSPELVFVSTRNAKEKRELNIFIADWVP
jgi:hypothetical protein